MDADEGSGLTRAGLSFAAENYAKEGIVNEGALRSMVKQMVQSNLIDAKLAASTPVTAYYDNRYVEEVKRSGFLISCGDSRKASCVF